MQYCFAAAAVLCAMAARGARADDAEKGFQQRARWYIQRIAEEDPVQVMEWANRVSLGDPHKYAMPPILARLALDAKDPKALAAYRMSMEVDRKKADRGLYHFAAYPRTRMYFAFRDKLPADVLDSMRFDVTNFYGQLRRGGTENHTWMHRCSGYLWTEELPEVGRQPAPAREGEAAKSNQQWQIDWLKGELRRLYTAGQGEYDSSTYVAFSLASLSNIFDYSKDPKMRDVARAAMDWMAAAQALKQFHGCNVGPEARGFAARSVDTVTDWTNWLWYGDTPRAMGLDERPADKDLKPSKHATICLALSGYRPHPVIRAIATKKLALPFEARNSKPTYYGGRANKDQEYLYVNNLYAMGTLYCPDDGVATVGTILPQTTMFKLAILNRDDVRTFGMANGYHGHFPVEGRTPYDQYHQYKDTAINISVVEKPEDRRTKHRSILAVPLGLREPHVENGWFRWLADGVLVGAYPLSGKAAFEDLVRWDEKKQAEVKIESKTHRFLVSQGKVAGWVIHAGQVHGTVPNQSKAGGYGAGDDFDGALSRFKVDVSKLAQGREVTVTTDAGDVLRLRHTGGPGGRPEAWTNGKALDYAAWPVFDSPYMKQEPGKGILRLSDGKATVDIDCSGEWPRWVEGKGQEAQSRGQASAVR